MPPDSKKKHLTKILCTPNGLGFIHQSKSNLTTSQDNLSLIQTINAKANKIADHNYHLFIKLANKNAEKKGYGPLIPQPTSKNQSKTYNSETYPQGIAPYLKTQGAENSEYNENLMPEYATPRSNSTIMKRNQSDLCIGRNLPILNKSAIPGISHFDSGNIELATSSKIDFQKPAVDSNGSRKNISQSPTRLLNDSENKYFLQNQYSINNKYKSSSYSKKERRGLALSGKLQENPQTTGQVKSFIRGP